MTLENVLDSVALVALIGGVFFSVVAAVGLIRFTHLLSRLHAATKPQVFGLLLIIMSIALHHRSFAILLALLPVFIFQVLTAPVGAHMVGRASYRSGQLDPETLVLDELAPAIERANRRSADDENSESRRP